jgi:HPt (histidine-containing phosphotransfer) domain-containing protein
MNHQDDGNFSKTCPAAELRITAIEDLAELIPGYLDHCRDHCRKISELLDHGDFDSIHAIAHGMKGSGGIYGFKMISQIASWMASAARANDIGETRRQIENLAWYLDQVEVLYD